MILDNVTQIVYIVCLIVVFLFAVAFIAIAALYFNAKKSLYNNKIEDPKVQKDVDKYYERIVSKERPGENLYITAERERKTSKIWIRIWSFFLIVIYVLILAVLGYGAYNKAQGNLTFVGHVAPLVIRSSSMQSIDSNNQYLKDNNLEGEENRIHVYAYITINNDPNIIKEIAPYDVVAFKMSDPDDNTQEITVVHRVISIEEKNGEKLYTFRGDANPGSLPGEIEVSANRIVGVYKSKNFKGAYNLGFGYFAAYIQDPAGIITISISFLLLVIYSFLFDGITACYDKRFLALLNEKIKKASEATSQENNVAEIVEVKKDGETIAVSPSLGGATLETKSVETSIVPLESHKERILPGFYLSDNSEDHILTMEKSIYEGQNEYSYSGNIENGEVSFGILKFIRVPENKIPNYGYTFEGIADKIFKVENALRCWHNEQDRSFVYIKDDSKLTFVGDKNKKYKIYVRLFDNEFNDDDNRWIVIYAEEEK